MSKLDGWRKSSFSQTGSCVEVHLDDVVRVRDSKDPASPVLSFTHHEWLAFLEGARGGEFDLPSHLPPEQDIAY